MNWLKVNFGKQVYELLREIVHKLEDVTWRQALDVLRAYLTVGADGTPPDGVTADQLKAVDKIVKALKLRDDVQKIRTFLETKTGQLLLAATDKVGAIDGELPLPLYSQSFDWGTLTGPADLVVNFTNNGVDLHAELDALPADRRDFLSTAPSADQTLLRIGMDGSLKVGANANFNLGFLSGSGQASGGAQASLDYFFRHDPETLLIQALAEDVPNMVSPMDPRDVNEAYHDTLEAIRLIAKGSVRSALDVKASKVWGASFKVNSGPGSQHTVNLGLTAKASFDASFDFDGTFELLVEPLDGDRVRVRVSRGHDSTAQNTLGLAVVLGVDGLSELGLELVDRYMKDAEPLKKLLLPYMELGTTLRKELQSKLLPLIKNEDSTGMLVNTLKVLLGTADEKGLADELLKYLRQIIDTKADALSQDGKEAAKEIVAKWLSQLEIPAAVQDKLAEKLADLIEKALTKLKDKLAKELDKLQDKGKKELEKLFARLGDIGEDVNQLVDDINAKSKAALTPVINFIERYQAVRQKLIAFLKDSARHKLELSLGRTAKTVRSKDVLLEFEIHGKNGQFNDSVKDAYRRMMLGDFREAVALAKTRNDIHLVDGAFKSVLEKTSGMDLSINFFGLEFSTKALLSSEVVIELDGQGNVVMASNRATYEKSIAAFKESRGIEFISAFELAGATAADETDKVFSAGLTLSYSDESLHRDELRQFLGSLTSWKLVSQAQEVQALAKFDELQTRSEQKVKAADITIAMPLSSDNLRRLFLQSSAHIRERACHWQMEIYCDREARDEMRLLLTHNGSQPDRFVSNLLGLHQSSEFVAIETFLGVNASRTSKQAVIVRTAWDISNRANRMVDAVALMRKAASMDLSRADAETQLDNLNRKIMRELRAWLKVRGILGGFFTERIPRETIAFIAVMADLCELDIGNSPLVPVIQWNQADGGQAVAMV